MRKEKIKSFDNSFFHHNYAGLSVLLFVPHEDDEINTAGALIHALTRGGAEVHLVYTTNGDWKYPAEIRFKEAVAAARVLGVDSNRIIFLGYGDSFNNSERNHIFYAEKEPAVSKAGHCETYGSNKYPDYSYSKNGKHNTYIKGNYLQDLVSIIESIKADFIICTDFDEHSDHRMLSLCFDRAMGIVRRNNPLYCPEIWKRFAYSLAYTAEADYCRINNPETKRPLQGRTGKYALDIIGKSIYKWEDRIRIPVPHSKGNCLKKNLIATALRKHKSQRIITHADRIINSDEVFWRRRTDSVSYLATVSTSSGNAKYLNDFMLYNVDNVDDATPPFVDYYWRPDENDEKKEAVFTWDESQEIQRVVLYSKIEQKSSIKKLSLTFDDGSQYIVDNVPNNGNPCIVDVKTCDVVKKCTIKILATEGEEYGLSECEFYSLKERESCIGKYCKILINDNFVYEYYTDYSTTVIPLDVYSSCDSSDISFKVISGDSKILDNKLFIAPADKEIIIRCSLDGDSWDQIVIHRLKSKEKEYFIKESKKDSHYLQRQRQLLKIQNMLYILRYQGFVQVIKRTYRNVLEPMIK